jgi:ribosomal-protein-alanine N-acetyltransferase
MTPGASCSVCIDSGIARALPFPAPPLIAAGFRLRGFSLDDWAAASAAADEAETARFVNGLPASSAAEMVRFCERERRKGSMLDLVIADNEDDSYLGEILIFAQAFQCGEIAYVVAPAARGRGVATVAVELLTRWAFDALELERIQLKIEPDNAASIRVAEKAGYQREGLLRSAGTVRGRRIDLLVYSRLRDD